MCWYVEFKVVMMGNQIEQIENVEKVIEDFKVKPDRRAIRDVTFVKGSVSNGYRTALHCDCDNVKSKKEENSEKVKLLYYPELFNNIMDQPGVKNIQMHMYWSEDKPKSKDVKITINEFLKQNNEFGLRANVSYKILKEKYY